MIRTIRFLFMTAVVLTAASEARAQYGYARGYGGYGWGGWGSTPGSSMARGLGMMNMGRGMYNVDTAQARSINTNTVIRYNQAMFNSERSATKLYVARRQKLAQDDEKAYSDIQDRLRNHPTARDVTDGDALNTLLDVLLNPASADISLQQIKTPLRPDVISNIPFELASEGMTVCLDRMTMDGQWPQAVLGDEFRPERDGLRKAIQAALEEDKEGEIDPQSVQAVQAAIDRLRTKFEKLVPHTSPDYVTAHWSIKAMDGLTKMLYSPGDGQSPRRAGRLPGDDTGRPVELHARLQPAVWRGQLVPPAVDLSETISDARSSRPIVSGLPRTPRQQSPLT